MAVIKSGATTDQWTIDPTSKAGRVTLYDASGNPLSLSNPLNVNVTNSSLNVNVSNTPTVNANVTNANVNVKVADSYRFTYTVTFKGITPIASATSPFIVFTSNGLKTVKIWRILFSCTAATGTAGGDLWAAKFTSITGGTVATTPTVAKALDTNPNSNVTSSSFSVVPTTATLADGFYFAQRYVIPTGGATNPAPSTLDYPFEDNNDNGVQPPTLTAAVPIFGIGLSVVGNTSVADVRIVWTEE